MRSRSGDSHERIPSRFLLVLRESGSNDASPSNADTDSRSLCFRQLRRSASRDSRQHMITILFFIRISGLCFLFQVTVAATPNTALSSASTGSGEYCGAMAHSRYEASPEKMFSMRKATPAQTLRLYVSRKSGGGYCSLDSRAAWS